MHRPDDTPTPSPDRTASGKRHFEGLDGLRGTAALLVVLFHLRGVTVDWNQPDLKFLHHAPLAVDFFLALSGFVIGYAYDDRWQRMGVRRFLTLRLIRLHPLVVLGALLGLTSYLFDPFAGGGQSVPPAILSLAFVAGLLVLPSASLPGRWADTYPLNGPSWSLLLEYIGNVAYALLLRHRSTRWLGMAALLSGTLLFACGVGFGKLDHGHQWDDIWMGPVRLAYSFIIGLWLHRRFATLPKIALGWVPLSLVLAVVVAVPVLPVVHGIALNGVYEAVCVLLVFPLIILAGARSQPTGAMLRACRLGGRLSYSLYVTHMPFLYVWMNYVRNGHPAHGLSVATQILLVPALLVVAWLAAVAWDRPIRAGLARRIR